MGLFGGQMANVVEWQEYRDDIIFRKWKNDEIKKGSRLVARPGCYFYVQRKGGGRIPG